MQMEEIGTQVSYSPCYLQFGPIGLFTSRLFLWRHIRRVVHLISIRCIILWFVFLGIAGHNISWKPTYYQFCFSLFFVAHTHTHTRCQTSKTKFPLINQQNNFHSTHTKPFVYLSLTHSIASNKNQRDHCSHTHICTHHSPSSTAQLI